MPVKRIRSDLEPEVVMVQPEPMNPDFGTSPENSQIYPWLTQVATLIQQLDARCEASVNSLEARMEQLTVQGEFLKAQSASILPELLNPEILRVLRTLEHRVQTLEDQVQELPKHYTQALGQFQLACSTEVHIEAAGIRQTYQTEFQNFRELMHNQEKRTELCQAATHRVLDELQKQRENSPEINPAVQETFQRISQEIVELRDRVSQTEREEPPPQE